MTPLDKLDAKTANEQLKTIAAFANTLGAGSVVAGGIAPLATDKPPSGWTWVFLVGGATLAHCFAHLMLRFMTSEE